MLADVGSSIRIRGYYEGRYRDKNVIDAQLELRQHIWHRNGIVLWVGAAEVFPRYKDLRFSQILPNAGLGYRWQFKKGVNVRLDYGFSRNGTGLYSISMRRFDSCGFSVVGCGFSVVGFRLWVFGILLR